MYAIDKYKLITELHRISRIKSQSCSSVTRRKPRVTLWLKNNPEKQYTRKLISAWILCFLLPGFLSGQIKVRIFTGFNTDSVCFAVIAGRYNIEYPDGSTATLEQGQNAIIIKNGEKLILKTMNDPFWSISDSVLFKGVTGEDTFSLSTGSAGDLTRYYSGDLQCKPDLGTILLINTCDIESYIAGVVMIEGGSGRHPEYFKTQSVIARTYLYRHFGKHSLDGFNLCDDVHCQAFKGITDDPVIKEATLATKGLVILGPDSLPAIAAFHSNCGGETLSSDQLWLTGQPYLKKVKDIYCTSSRNAKWRKSFRISDWIAYLKNAGLTTVPADRSLFNFTQTTRLKDYKVGSFTVPLAQLREDLGLRSTFFSVKVAGDSVILDGRGYGHGVGLCQEGAMVMASKGIDFKKIINFYYKGVKIMEVGNAVSSK